MSKKTDKIELMLPNPLAIGRQYHFALQKAIHTASSLTGVLAKIKKSHEVLIDDLIEDLKILEKDNWEFEIQPYGFIKAYKYGLKFSSKDPHKDELAGYLQEKGVKNIYDCWGSYDLVKENDKSLSLNEEQELYEALDLEEKNLRENRKK